MRRRAFTNEPLTTALVPRFPEGDTLSPVSGPASRNPAVVYLARLAPGSRRTMRKALDVVAAIATDDRCNAETCPWGAMRYQHTQAIKAALIKRYASRTANLHLAALRNVLREAWRLKYMSAEDYHLAVDIGGVKIETLPAGREVKPYEIRALFEVCAENPLSPTCARDAAILALLYGAGLRRSEAVSLNVNDYDNETGAIAVRHGKGGKGRSVYLADGGRAALADWIRIRSSEPGPLLYPVNKGQKIQRRRMTDQAVQCRLRQLAKRAKIKPFSPHDLRRSFISHLFNAGADPSAVKGLAGHASVETTVSYDRRGERAKKEAAELLHVPYVKFIIM